MKRFGCPRLARSIDMSTGQASVLSRNLQLIDLTCLIFLSPFEPSNKIPLPPDPPRAFTTTVSPTLSRLDPRHRIFITICVCVSAPVPSRPPLVRVAVGGSPKIFAVVGLIIGTLPWWVMTRVKPQSHRRQPPRYGCFLHRFEIMDRSNLQSVSGMRCIFITPESAGGRLIRWFAKKMWSSV